MVSFLLAHLRKDLCPVLALKLVGIQAIPSGLGTLWLRLAAPITEGNGYALSERKQQQPQEQGSPATGSLPTFDILQFPRVVRRQRNQYYLCLYQLALVGEMTSCTWRTELGFQECIQVLLFQLLDCSILKASFLIMKVTYICW